MLAFCYCIRFRSIFVEWTIFSSLPVPVDDDEEKLVAALNCHAVVAVQTLFLSLPS